MDIFVQQLVNGLTLGAVYAIVALGYTMVYGIIQLINFAHGEVVMIGCMVAFSVIVALAGSGMPPLVIVALGIAAAVPVCMAVGYVVERVAYRPLRHAPQSACSTHNTRSMHYGDCIEAANSAPSRLHRRPNPCARIRQLQGAGSRRRHIPGAR